MLIMAGHIRSRSLRHQNVCPISLLGEGGRANSVEKLKGLQCVEYLGVSRDGNDGSDVNIVVVSDHGVINTRLLSNHIDADVSSEADLWPGRLPFLWLFLALLL